LGFGAWGFTRSLGRLVGVRMKNVREHTVACVWGLGFGVWGLGFGVWGLGFGVWGLGFGVWGSGFHTWSVNVEKSAACPSSKRPPHSCDEFVGWGLGFGVWGLGFGVWGSPAALEKNLGTASAATVVHWKLKRVTVRGLGFGVWGFGFWVLGLGFGVLVHVIASNMLAMFEGVVGPPVTDDASAGAAGAVAAKAAEVAAISSMMNITTCD